MPTTLWWAYDKEYWTFLQLTNVLVEYSSCDNFSPLYANSTKTSITLIFTSKPALTNPRCRSHYHICFIEPFPTKISSLSLLCTSMANNNHNIQHLNGTRNNQQRLVQILGRQYSASNNGKGNRVVNDSNPVVASPFSSAKPSLSHQQPAVRAGAPASNSSSSTIIDHEENDDDEYSSSGDEFPEITEEEIETWSGVEQKRLHFRTCVQRDEQLLRQVLIFKPFECKTKKERYEKWQCVTRNCDEIIKLLPDNSTLQLNFFFPKHAKRRFKVIMEAHHSLINNNKNPMFLGIYGEYGSLQGLIERAYQLVTNVPFALSVITSLFINLCYLLMHRPVCSSGI